MDFGLIFNCTIIMVFIVTLIYYYNKYPNYFLIMSIILLYWVQLLISSAYIETGVYLKDIGVVSYKTGVTFRLFIYLELIVLTIMFLIKRFGQKKDIEFTITKNDSIFYIIFLAIMIYRLFDIIFSGNIITNPSINRFNYFTTYSKFPLANVIEYFSYPLMWIFGYHFVASKGKSKLKYLFLLIINIACLYLRGIQFGGYLQCTIYFFSPFLINFSKNRKIFRIKYVALAVFLLLLMLIPKYNHFTTALKNGNVDTSYGIDSASKLIMYRALAQEADLTWEIDRQVYENRKIDPNHYFEELKSIIGLHTDSSTGVQYLMDRGLSASALRIYGLGSAAVTGGYPYIWVSMFGLYFSIIFMIIDAILLFMLLNLIVNAFLNRRLVLILMACYILCQCYTIILSADLGTLGNTIPSLFIILLLFLHNKKIVYNKDRRH